MRSWSRFRPCAVVAAPESMPVDVLAAVANHRDLPTFIQHLSTKGANAIRVSGVLASMTYTSNLFMHGADESGALGTLHPIRVGAGRMGGVTGWRREVHEPFHSYSGIPLWMPTVFASLELAVSATQIEKSRLKAGAHRLRAMMRSDHPSS
jgi:hypothetical protein